MNRLISLGTIVFLLLPSIASSQEAPAFGPDSRVRVTERGSGGGRRHSGTVVIAGTDTLVLRLDKGGDSVAFPLAGLSRIEVGREKTHAAVGGVLGFITAAGLVALLATSDCGDSTPCLAGTDSSATILDEAEGALILLALGTLSGTAIGGLLWKTESWKAVPESRWRLSIGPAKAGGFGLSLAIRF